MVCLSIYCHARRETNRLAWALIEYFVMSSCYENLLRGLVDAFVLHFDSALHDDRASLNPLTSPLNILHHLFEHDASRFLSGSLGTSLFPYIFLFTFLLPQFVSVDTHQTSIAKRMWDKWTVNVPYDAQESTLAVIKHLLHELLVDCLTKPTYVRSVARYGQGLTHISDRSKSCALCQLPSSRAMSTSWLTYSLRAPT